MLVLPATVQYTDPPVKPAGFGNTIVAGAASESPLGPKEKTGLPFGAVPVCSMEMIVVALSAPLGMVMDGPLLTLTVPPLAPTLPEPDGLAAIELPPPPPHPIASASAHEALTAFDDVMVSPICRYWDADGY
jgi:hypothetical protein